MFRRCVGLLSSHSNMHVSQLLMTGTSSITILSDLLIQCSLVFLFWKTPCKLRRLKCTWVKFLGGCRDDVWMITQVTWDDVDAPPICHMLPPENSTKPVWGFDIANDLMMGRFWDPNHSVDVWKDLEVHRERPQTPSPDCWPIPIMASNGKHINMKTYENITGTNGTNGMSSRKSLFTFIYKLWSVFHGTMKLSVREGHFFAMLDSFTSPI